MASGELSHRYESLDDPPTATQPEPRPVSDRDVDDLFKVREGGVVELLIDRLYSDRADVRNPAQREDPVDRLETNVGRPVLESVSSDAGRHLHERMPLDRWQAADRDDRVKLAHEAHACIRESYGLDATELHVSSKLENRELGLFDPDSGRVSINQNLLSEATPHELIKTIAHENGHALQEVVMNGNAKHPLGDLGKPELEAWREGERTYDALDYLGVGYRYNPLEVDANDTERHVIDGYNAAHDEARETQREGLTARITSLEAHVERQDQIIEDLLAQVERQQAIIERLSAQPDSARSTPS